MPDLPTRRVRLLTTGGTIASTPDEATGAMRAATSGKELVAAVPALADLARVDVEEVALVNSWDVDLTLMADLARRVEAAADLADGVVITHGTDTLEETAFALDFLADCELPVVLTGAMRGGGGPDSDGPGNLIAAVRVAASDAAQGLRCVVLGDELHAARWVHKTHSTALDTFASPGVGPMGTVDDAGVLLRWRPQRRDPLRAADGGVPASAEPVALVWSAAGLPPRALQACAEGARGVVIAGSGAGNVPGTWLPVIRALVRGGLPVVLASRCEGGRVVPTYGGDGGGRTLVDAGVLPAGDLSAVKARVALAFALGAGLDMDQIRGLLDPTG